MMDNRKQDLSNYRLSQAEDSIKVAQMSFDNGLYKVEKGGEPKKTPPLDYLYSKFQ